MSLSLISFDTSVFRADLGAFGMALGHLARFLTVAVSYFPFRSLIATEVLRQSSYGPQCEPHSLSVLPPSL